MTSFQVEELPSRSIEVELPSRWSISCWRRRTHSCWRRRTQTPGISASFCCARTNPVKHFGAWVEAHPGGQVEHQADPEEASRMAREMASLPAFRRAIGCASHTIQKPLSLSRFGLPQFMLVDLLTPSDIKYHDSSARSEALLRAAADALVDVRYKYSQVSATLHAMGATPPPPAALSPPAPLAPPAAMPPPAPGVLGVDYWEYWA